MKVRIEIAENLVEDEIIIKCKQITKTIQNIQKTIIDETSSVPKLTFYKQNEEYYFTLEEILFFETNKDLVYAHTAGDAFRIKFRLYELEDILPHYFIRVSKSTILNTRRILSIEKNLTSASLVQFYKSHKQVYVSRLYYKSLRQRLSERSHYED